MFRGAHCLAQGVAPQVEEHQLRAGGNRLKCCRLLETLGRRVKERLASSPQILFAPVHSSLFFLAAWLVGISHTSLEGVRLWAGTTNTCPQGPGRKHRGQAGLVLEVVETVAKKVASHG